MTVNKGALAILVHGGTDNWSPRRWKGRFEGVCPDRPVRLLPTTAATTLRKEDPPLVLDGPFAETKEQLLGFYVVDCKNLDEALDVARDLGKANPGGAYEIRPVGHFTPGDLPKRPIPTG
jgi:hypothetical protein